MGKFDELNKKAISTIKSTYIKNYLNSINHEFTVDEQLTLIDNSTLTIKEKKEIYNKYLELLDKDSESAKDINTVIEEIGYIEGIAGNREDTVIVFDTPITCENTCARNIDKVKELYAEYNDSIESECEADEYNSINVVNIDTSAVLAYLTVNKNGDIINYYIKDDKYARNHDKFNRVMDKYVYIPNDLKEYDIITETGDVLKNEYIIVDNIKLPDELKDKAMYSDASVMAIKKSTLDEYIKSNYSKAVSYKTVIDELMENQIDNFDSNDEYSNIITDNHEHIHLTIIEKGVQ